MNVYLIIGLGFAAFMAVFLGWAKVSTDRERTHSQKKVDELCEAGKQVVTLEIFENESVNLQITLGGGEKLTLSDLDERVVKGWFDQLQRYAPGAEAFVSIYRNGRLLCRGLATAMADA